MTIAVECQPSDEGWACTVTVGDDADATVHEVRVGRSTLGDLAPQASVEELVRTSFDFLLEREPREAIMRAFELPIIGRYFPEYPEDIRRRMRR